MNLTHVGDAPNAAVLKWLLQGGNTAPTVDAVCLEVAKMTQSMMCGARMDKEDNT